jgi:hypothetical protein
LLHKVIFKNTFTAVKHVLRGNWAKRKPVFIGKMLQSEESGVPGIHTSIICGKQNLPGTEKKFGAL